MGCNYTDKIKCPKCGDDFGIEIEIEGNQSDELEAKVTPLDYVDCPSCQGTGKLKSPFFPESCPICRGTGRIKIERQQHLEEWLPDKLIALKSSTFYEGKPVTEEQGHRIKVMEDILQEYREKKAKGWLKVQ